MRAALCHEIHAFACLDANLGVWAWQGRERDVHRAAFASLKDTVLGGRCHHPASGPDKRLRAVRVPNDHEVCSIFST